MKRRGLLWLATVLFLIGTALAWSDGLHGLTQILAGSPNIQILATYGGWSIGTTLATDDQTGAGTSYTIVSGDNAKVVLRSNSGTAMTDILPNVSASGFGAGFKTSICNEDATANDTLSVNSPSTIFGSSSVTIPAKTCVSIGDPKGTNYDWFSPFGITSSGVITANYLPQWINSSTLGAGLPVGTTGNSTVAETKSSGKLDNSIVNLYVPPPIGWVAGQQPNGAPFITAPQTYTISSITLRVETAVGATATVSVYDAPNGTSCASGTLVSTSGNANGTPATNQSILGGGGPYTINSGDTLCLSTTGGSNWNNGSGVGGVTIALVAN